MDGQIKQVNQVLEQYLWLELLAMAKLDYNNIVHSLTQQTPFFANHDLHPSFTFKVCIKS
jgi:hypothetical protein